MPGTKPYIPASVAELSPAWVTEVMRQAGTLDQDQIVTGVQLRTLDGGTGFQGVASRVELTYSDGVDAPETVVAKFPTLDAFNRGIAEQMRSYEREILFYQDIAHTMPVRTPIHHGSALDSGPPKQVVNRAMRLVDRLPKAAHVKLASDPKNVGRPSKRRFALLIEDYGDVTVHDAAAAPNDEQMADMLSVLAQMHAFYWGRDDLADHAATDIVVSKIPVLQRNMWDVTGLPVVTERFGSGGLSQEAMALLPGIADSFVEDIARLNRPMTLCHGDARSDNWLFLKDGSVSLVDWALPGYVDPGFDVGYLLGACVDPTRGRSQSEELCRHYLAELAALGVDHSFDELWETVEAQARVQVVLHSFGLSYTNLSYGDKVLGDFFIPQGLSILLGSAF